MPKVTFLTFSGRRQCDWMMETVPNDPKNIILGWWDLVSRLVRCCPVISFLWWPLETQGIRTDKWTKCTKLLENIVFFQHVLEGIVQKSCFFTENMLFSFSMLTIIPNIENTKTWSRSNMGTKKHDFHEILYFLWFFQIQKVHWVTFFCTSFFPFLFFVRNQYLLV